MLKLTNVEIENSFALSKARIYFKSQTFRGLRVHKSVFINSTSNKKSICAVGSGLGRLASEKWNTSLTRSNICTDQCQANALSTYIAILVRDVVGQFELVETDHLLHPLLTRARGVRMDVTSPGHLRVGFAGHCPLAVVELVPAIVHRHDVHKKEIFGFLVQAGQPDFVCWKYSPARKRRKKILVKSMSAISWH